MKHETKLSLLSKKDELKTMTLNLQLALKLICIVFTRRELTRLSDPSFRLPGMIKFTSSSKYVLKNIIYSLTTKNKIPNSIESTNIICDSGTNEKSRRTHLGEDYRDAFYINKSMADGFPGVLPFIVSILAFIPVFLSTLIINRRLMPSSNIWTWFSLFNECLNVCRLCIDEKHLYLYGLHQANHNWIVSLLLPNVTSISSDTPLSYHSTLAVCHHFYVSQKYQLAELKLIDSLKVTGNTSLLEGHSGNDLSVPHDKNNHSKYGVLISSGVWLRVLDKKPFDFKERLQLEQSLMNRVTEFKHQFNLERVMVSLHPSEVKREKECQDFYNSLEGVDLIGSFSMHRDLIMNADYIFGGFTTTSFDIINIAEKMEKPPIVEFFLTETESKMAFTSTSVASYFIQKDSSF